jgi:hypothetical protein
MTIVKVNYTDASSNPQVDGYVDLAQYGYWHVEGSDSDWTIKITTVSAPTTQTATLAATFSTRDEALTALAALAEASGQVLDVATL